MFIIINPLITLMLISLVMSFLITIAYKFFTNKEVLDMINKEVKENRDEAKRSKNNPKKIIELQRQLLSLNTKRMRQSFKPLLITIVPIIIVFRWVGSNFKGIIFVDKFGWKIGWFGIYIIMSLVSGIILRIILKVKK